jgi:hypothetical protein
LKGRSRMRRRRWIPCSKEEKEVEEEVVDR